MALRFEKTALGHQEIRQRSHGLSRTARMLLVLSDGQRSDDELLSMVNGSSMADLDQLIEIGLVAVVGGLAADEPAMSDLDTQRALQQISEDAAADAAREEAGVGLGFAELYDSLNALAKEQLGLFKGYRFSLEIEKANGIDEMREVAKRFVVEVRKAKGESAAQMVRRALGLGG